MGRKKIIFRADGHAKMGLGHVIRSLALADMLKDVFDCHFIIRDPLPTLKDQILAVCSSLKVLDNTNDDLGESKLICNTYLDGSEIVVLDGYHFRTKYQQNIRDKGCKVVCIDDIHDYHFVADVVINHAGGLTRADYSLETTTDLYLGVEYALLRKEFLSTYQIANKADTELLDENLLISLGGADPNNDTLNILKQCFKKGFKGNVYLILGAAFLYRYEIEKYINSIPQDIIILSNLSAQDMSSVMNRCKIAITPPSTISFEYLSIGGQLYLKQIADNQKDIMQYFLKENLAFSFDEEFLNIPEVRIQKAIEKQNELFDGKSNERLLEMFKKLAS